MENKESNFFEGSAIQREFENFEDPFALFNLWMTAAEEREPSDPNAMTVATVDASGMPNARILLLKGVSPEGFVFYTNIESTKGQELDVVPKAALCFYWKSLNRQVRVRGGITSVTAEEADAYFESRHRGSQIGAWASDQSRTLESRKVFDDAIQTVSAQYEGRDIPRPPYWSGYLLTPIEIEFWQARESRLHDRIRFSRQTTADSWTKALLYP